MTTAEDLMTKRFLRISTEHNLREALALLLYGEQQNAETAAIAVIDTQGNFAGTLTPECVVSGLSRHSSKGHPTPESLQCAIDENFPATIDHVMKTNAPIANRKTSLAQLIAWLGEEKHECIPVCEDGSVIGLVYVSDVFKATATLALSEADQGIQLS